MVVEIRGGSVQVVAGRSGRLDGRHRVKHVHRVRSLPGVVEHVGVYPVVVGVRQRIDVVVKTPPRQLHTSPAHQRHNHRHRIDKYLDTQPISGGEATDHCQKNAPQDGGLPELIVARYCVTKHSEAASL